MPRLRVRLDWLHEQDNILRQSHAMLDQIAFQVCLLLFWDLGETSSKHLCSEESLSLKVTNLLGIPAFGVETKNFKTLTEE